MKVESTPRPDCGEFAHTNRGSKRKSEAPQDDDSKKVRREYAKLKQTFHALEERHKTLKKEHQGLSEDLDALSESHDQLVEEQAQLKKEHATLQKEHAKLKEDYHLEIHDHIDEMKTLEKNVRAAYSEEKRELKDKVNNYRKKITDMAQYAAVGGYKFESEYYSSEED